MALRRIPPPPTRFGPAISQAKPALGPARGRFAPPPVHGGASLQRKATAAPAAKPAAKPLLTARHGARAVQRAVTTTTAAPRPVVECTMGQGVQGSLERVVLHSRRFSTCTPIVMFNDMTWVGGLFHYAAGDFKAQQGPLSSLMNRILPSLIYIGKRAVDSTIGGAFDRTEAETSDDFEIIAKFLKVKGYDGEIKTLGRAAQYYVWLDSSNKLQITYDLPKGTGDWIDFTYSKTPTIPSTAAAAMKDVVLFGQNLYPDGKPV